MKRKFLILLIALVAITSSAMMLLSLSACNQAETDETICGHWVTEKVIRQAADMSIEGISEFNITINEDGTMTARYPSRYTYVDGTGTWEEDNGTYKIEIIYDNDEISHFTGAINKKRLTLKESNTQWSISTTYIMIKSN